MDDVNDLSDTVRELAENQDYTGDQILLVIDEKAWTGICGPDVDGHSHEDAPFEFVTTDSPPDMDTVAETFGNALQQKIQNVRQQVADSNEPLETIRDMDIDNVIYFTEQ